MSNGPTTHTGLACVYRRLFDILLESNSPFINKRVMEILGALTRISGTAPATTPCLGTQKITTMQGPWGMLSEPKPMWWIRPYPFACTHKGKHLASTIPAILLKPLVLLQTGRMQIDGFSKAMSDL
ncbi:hypothetical protein V8C42DRAFT_14725 [Trichoderma barbatum]